LRGPHDWAWGFNSQKLRPSASTWAVDAAQVVAVSW